MDKMNRIRYWLVFKLRHLLDWIHPDYYNCWSCTYICTCVELDKEDNDTNVS